MGFVVKTVNAEGGLGQDLAELRSRAGYSIEQVTRATKLPPSVIHALENEDWSRIPDPVHWERQVRAYVGFLGGNASYYILKYREALKSQRLEVQPKDFLPRPIRIRPMELLVGSRWFAVAGFLSLFLGLGTYVYWQARAISSAPPLALQAPADGLQLDGPVVQVRGQTSPESSVTVNGTQAVVGTDGEFTATIHVPRGTTMVVVSARKRHGKEATLVRRVLYDRVTSRSDTDLLN